MNRIKKEAYRGLAYVGKAALLSLGILVVLALAVAAAILVPVMLAATIMPTTVAGFRRGRSTERYAGYVLDLSTSRSRERTTWQNRTQ
jgi:hypothetical protein